MKAAVLVPYLFSGAVPCCGASEFTGCLHAHNNAERHRRLGAEIASLVCVAEVGGAEALVAVELLVVEAVVGESAVHYFTVDLHPAVGERYVDEIQKSGGGSRYGPCVGAAHKIARRKCVVGYAAVPFLHASQQIYRSELKLAI